MEVRMQSYEAMRTAVLCAARDAKAAGLCTGGTGNCSMIDRAAGVVAMTPHDSDRVAHAAREIVLMDLAGNVLDAPEGVFPTSEAAFHLALYRARPDLIGICHTHAPYATVFAALGRALPPVTTEALLYGQGDFAKSICLAVESGFDTDCNGATVGSVLGMRNGQQAIGPEWTNPLHGELDTSIFGVGRISIDTLIDQTMRHIKR